MCCINVTLYPLDPSPKGRRTSCSRYVTFCIRGLTWGGAGASRASSLGPLVLYAGDSGWSGIHTWIQKKKFGFGLPRRQLWHFYHTPPSNVPSQCCDICATHDKKRCRFLNNSFFSYQWLVRFIEKSYVLSVTKVWKWTYSILRERR